MKADVQGMTVANADASTRPGVVVVRLATERDNAELLELTRACPMEGDIGLCVDRAPNFFVLNQLEGDDMRVGVALGPEGQVVGSIAVALRRIYLGGRPKRIGYMGDLKVSPAFRTQQYADALTRWACRMAGELACEDIPILATVLAGNKNMERRVSGPRDTPELTRFATTRAHSLFFLWKRAVPAFRGSVRRATAADLDDMVAFWQKVARERDFAFAFEDRASFEKWLARAPGLSISDFWVARDDAGQVRGFLGFWDQDSFKHMLVTRYSSTLARVRQVFNLAAPLLGATPLPPVGEALRYVTAVNICVPAGDVKTFRTLVLTAYNALRKQGLSLMTIGLDVRDPLAGGLRGLLAQPTDIHAYMTSAGGRYNGAPLTPQTFHNEIALV